MKKRFVGGVLAVTLLMGTASAAFDDIKSPQLSQTAAVLKSLKIMEGVSASAFAPERSLTRAEFAKLLVTAFGVTDVTGYKNYTVFPDVPNSHWAAGYINAAIKHPTVKEKRIIRGYADGTFKPDRTINYGEACTMLMLMLGYQVSDIGPMWPGDYISRAQAEGLMDGASVMSASSAVKRADAAVMLLNTLDTPGKEDIRLISALTSKSDSEGAILLATSETDPDLRKNQARFYTGEDKPVVKTTDGVLDRALIGVSGTLYYSKSSVNTVLTILPDNDGSSEEGTVHRVQRDRIELVGGDTIKLENKVLLYARGEVTSYAESWFNIQANDQIHLHYDKDGTLTLISTTAGNAAGTSFVYGTQGAAAVPAGFSITKNGVRVSIDALKKYDVVTLDTASKSAVVSDMRLTGKYDSGNPSFKKPEKIVVLGNEYAISERASAYFAQLKPGDTITLLLDARGAVAAAYPSSEVRADMIGVFTEMGDGARISLLNGLTVRGELGSPEDKNKVGQAVVVRQNSDGKLELGSISLSGKPAGSWDVENSTLGTKKVSPNVRVWEQVADKAPLWETSVSKLPFGAIASADIRYAATDSAGNITALVLGDVTGDAWNYGAWYFAAGGQKDDVTGEWVNDGQNTATLKFYDYEKKGEVSLTYNVAGYLESIGGAYVGFPKDAEKNETRRFLSTMRLNRVDNVVLSAFDGSDGVRTASGYYPLSDEVQVYLTEQKKFVTLGQAKADYDSFTLYAERTPEKGGKIRIITVS